MNKQRVFPWLCFIALTTIVSCKKETNAEEENENELITTVELRITENGTANVQTFTWEDIDGPGGNDPVADDITLDENKTYTVELSLWDKTKTPAEDITAEIEEEADVHRFYYTVSGGSGVTIGNLDKDPDGITVGLSSEWTTTSEGSGTVTIVLRHYPEGGKEESDPVTSSKSSTDAEVELNLHVGAH